MADLILAIDQGTTGSTVLLVDLNDNMKVIARKTVDFEQHYPHIGWVEHDLEEVWSSVAQAAAGVLQSVALSGIKPSDIKAIGITNQRETLCVFDRKTSRPLRRAIVWQCKRSTEICQRLKKEGLEGEFRQKTGLVLDPYFSGTKLSWLLSNEPETAAALNSGEAVCGTVDTYLVHRLTGGKSFVTEPSNASRTLGYNIREGAWDESLLEHLGVRNPGMLPEVKDSASEFGETSGLSFLPDGIPITGILGDQQAALAGQTCFEKGESKCTYGTGAFLLANIGEQALQSRFGLLTTVAWSIGGKRTFAFEGAAFVAGAAVQFLRDQLDMLPDAPAIEQPAKAVAAAPDIYFVPSLAGLGAPHWDPMAKGALMGLTRDTSKAQVFRAVLEGLAFQISDMISCMGEDLGTDLTVLRVDGGAAANDTLMQIQADFSGIPVDRPANLESTALGAALFAGLGCGVYSSFDQMRSVRTGDKVFATAAEFGAEKREQYQAGWSRAVDAVKVFAGTK